MAARRSLSGFLLAVTLAVGQSGHTGRRWARYEHEMQNPADDPPDAWEQTEFAFARLRYHSIRDRYYRWRWGTDANKSERQFVQGLRRLTRIHTRSVEHIADIDSDEIYEWPWMYAVAVGDWNLSDSHVIRLRNYFQRGGFLMVDDFHNESEWARFMAGVERILPRHRMVELEDSDPIFHTVFNLAERVRVPGLNVVHGDQIERGGIFPHWRGVLDDRGRVVIAICFNMDIGDAWEWADLPDYPERYASLAYRIGINYVVYAMTH
jgi:hypothetical protein